jgi:SNF2 family DNA or RNA helicase
MADKTRLAEGKLEYPFKTKPYQHQLACWERSKDKEVFAYFMEMGTGKSKVLVDTIAYQYDKGTIDAALIVAPKGCVMDWYDSHIPIHMPQHVQYQMAYWTAAPRKSELEALQALSNSSEDLQILVMNTEAFTTPRGTKFAEKFLCSHRALMAVDESTSIKHLTSQRTKSIISMRKFAKTRRIMTGDPTANSPLDIYAQCAFLDPHLMGFESFYTFKARFANLVRVNLGGRSFQQIAGYRDLDELNRLIRPFSFIIKKDECLDLPQKIYQPRRVEMGKLQREAYTQMKETATVILESKIGEYSEGLSKKEQMMMFEEEMHNLARSQEVCPTCGRRDTIVCSDTWHLRNTEVALTPPTATADLVITQLLKLHQVACGFLKTDDGTEHDFAEPNPRLNALVEVLQEVPKAIIWTNYRHTIFSIEKRLKEEFGDKSVVTYFGDTDRDERREAKEKFQNLDNDVRFFVSNPATGRFGLTLTAASTVVYYSNDYDQESRSQSEDRAHRIGQTKNVNYVDLYVPGTVDEKILNVLRNKKKLSAQITRSNWREWIA